VVKYLVIGGTALAYAAVAIHYWSSSTRKNRKKPLLGVVQPKKEKVSKSQKTGK